MLRRVDGGAVHGASARRHGDVLRQDHAALARKAKRYRQSREWAVRNKDHVTALKKAWRDRNRERLREYNRLAAKKWHASHPGYARKASHKSRYGLSPEQFDALFAAQDSRCAICRSDSPNSKHGWSVDHCHVTNKIRGILCPGCNLILGHAKDDTARLHSAAKYLEANR